MDVAPAEADKDHRLSGYEWRFYGDCGSTSWQRLAGETGTVTWRPSRTGSCDLQVYALGHYGSGSSVNSAVQHFTVS
ncbi:hypothetical protein [Streptomyces sp. NPDC102462]|uniref:hypothetical protein n=1 Tax=Streptomyces sp. NPDC102462 TaxID=3366178 RepID=UPI0038020167